MTELKIVSNQTEPEQEKSLSTYPLVDIMPLDQDENEALRNLSDRAFRLLLDMILTAHIEGNGLADVSGFHPSFQPRPFETPAAVEELVKAELITPAYYENEAGEKVHDRTFFVNIWNEMAEN